MKYLSKLLIKNVEIISAPDNEKYFLGIDNDTISVISKEMPTGFENAEIINASDKIAVPGLVNTHTHAAMTLLRSYADDMVLMDWLQNKIWPAEAGLNDEDIYWGTMLSIAEMLKTGTTCFADMYFAMDKVAQAVNETGIRASLSRGLVGLTPDADEKLQDNEMLFKNWHGKADGRIRVMFGPHAPYTCPVSYLKKVVAKAGELNAEIHMHLCETAGEVSDCVKEHNMTPIKLMNSLDHEPKALVITSYYHIFRSRIIADRIGGFKWYGSGCGIYDKKSTIFLLREPLAVIKTFFFDR